MTGASPVGFDTLAGGFEVSLMCITMKYILVYNDIKIVNAFKNGKGINSVCRSASALK